jgi:hypothetical protein
MKPIPELHALFCALTMMPISLDMNRERCWYEWQRKGWTSEDLKHVVAWIRKQNKAGGKYKLTFTKLVVELDQFEEKLMEARAESRKVVYPAAKASILRNTGRSDVPPSKECIQAGNRALGLLAEFKRGNV